jgi:hypothetical protein
MWVCSAIHQTADNLRRFPFINCIPQWGGTFVSINLGRKRGVGPSFKEKLNQKLSGFPSGSGGGHPERGTSSPTAVGVGPMFEEYFGCLDMTSPNGSAQRGQWWVFLEGVEVRGSKALQMFLCEGATFGKLVDVDHGGDCLSIDITLSIY